MGLGTGTLGGAPGIGSGSGLFNNPAGTQGRAGSTTGATGAPNAGNQPAAAGGTSIYGTPRADPTRTQGRTRVEIAVKMDDGRAQMVTAVNDAGLKTGDRVRVIDGKLMRIP
ncbi:MAG: hypothetical protein H7125_14755 [Proteobacteria bacterium]|nr:hypothetical protein [Burkholderiales bacterium]